ncbi:MAG: winged helix-turn-helix domain-containing protein [Litoreibacter sp.]|uniref:ArsR/SmtB family transcription factor n=1 Tax=Litoreibacter sp. TaxID=1969459 RepID=UPI00329843E0
MKEGPDIARIANLIGDPSRSNMLTALMSGKALTAGELASEAGVQLQTASGHLVRLEEGGLIKRERQGRHHYFRLADAEVATVLEALMGLAAAKGQLRTRTGPRDLELRHARVCYNHLAGELGVALYDGLRARGVLRGEGDSIALADTGRAEMEALGIELNTKSRSPECKSCLDWSARGSHLAGRLGRAILDHTFTQGWAIRPENTRIVRFTALGEAAFRKTFNF